MFNPKDKRLLCENVEVSHNYVTGAAYEYKGCVGIFSGYATRLNLAHNKVWNLPYTGISVGWGWSADSNSAMRENIVRANYVADCMTELSDGGLIYMLSAQPGSIVDSNYLAYNIGARGNFFYFDVGCAYFTIKHNGTHGASFTLGMGYGLTHLTIDSNWAEYGNYWSSNGALENSDVDKIYVTNMFIASPPQGIIDNAGPIDNEVHLTPVAIRPDMDFSPVKTPRNSTQFLHIYNLQGRLVASISPETGTDVESLMRRRVLPAGTYVITRQMETTGKKSANLFLKYQ
jgi:hypothetical protein